MLPPAQARLDRALQFRCAISSLKCGDKLLQASTTRAEQHAIVGAIIADAVIGHAILRTVVGADLLASIARADLAAAFSTFGSLLISEHLLIETRTKHAHSRDLVLQLRLLILRLHDQASRQVRDAHC